MKRNAEKSSHSLCLDDVGDDKVLLAVETEEVVEDEDTDGTTAVGFGGGSGGFTSWLTIFSKERAMAATEI